jgi:hypothetical protein
MTYFFFLLLQDAVSVLNTELLSRSPKDPPPPRRSKRGDGDEVIENATPKNGTKREDGDRNIHGDTGDTLRALQAGLVVSEEDVDSPAKDQSTKGRKRNARNVGGWVSPNFSAEIDRRWLQRDKADGEFDISAYVPQVGDTVLYYPGKLYFQKDVCRCTTDPFLTIASVSHFRGAS